MRATRRVLFLGAVVALALVGVTACTRPVGSASEPSSATDQETQDQNARALADYVDLERAQIPKILDQNPGLYSEVRIEGELNESSGQNGLAPGTHAVVFYSYLYANPVDWSTAIDALDNQRSNLDVACRTAIFPAMRNAGITGPLGAQFSYDDGSSDFGALWHHYCSDPD